MNPETILADALLTSAYELLHNYEHLLRNNCRANMKKRAQDLLNVLDVRSRIEDYLDRSSNERC